MIGTRCFTAARLMPNYIESLAVSERSQRLCMKKTFRAGISLEVWD
jgi:hypothetical protein